MRVENRSERGATTGLGATSTIILLIFAGQ
jgi:hypothetical protein